MILTPPIFLAASEGVGLDLVVWLIAGAVWLFGQIATARKNKEKKARQSRAESSTSSTLQSGGGNAPPPDELAEIFKRLGADIPATPPPPPPVSVPPQRHTKKPPHKNARRKTAVEHIQPALAQRLAQVRKAAEEASQLAETERIASQSIVQGVQSQSGESRALDTATQHTGTILPSLYAMSCRMAPLPSIPMPGLDRTHHANRPMRAKLHARREVRDALIAQTFLQPPKSFAR